MEIEGKHSYAGIGSRKTPRGILKVIKSQTIENQNLMYTNNKLYEDNKLRNQDWVIVDDLNSKEKRRQDI